MIIMPGYAEMSVPCLWHELKRQYGHLDESKRKLNAKLQKKSKKIKLAKEQENACGIYPWEKYRFIIQVVVLNFCCSFWSLVKKHK